jgi:hypothetical protein
MDFANLSGTRYPSDISHMSLPLLPIIVVDFGVHAVINARLITL